MIEQYHNGQWRVVSGKSGADILVITAEDSETISGISVPKLDEEQVQLAYNGIVAGKGVFIQGENDDYYAVYFANTADEVPTIYLIYKDSHIIKYELDEEVSISVKEIGSGSGAVESVNGKDGVVVLDATDIKLTTNQATIQANIIRIDEEIDDIEALIPNEASSSNKLATASDIQNVREVAEGKSKSFVLRYSEVFNPNYAESGRYIDKDGNVMSLEECEEFIEGKTNVNNIFNSQSNNIFIPQTNDNYLILEDYLGKTARLILINGGTDFTNLLKKGDVILITETNVPDRWYSDSRTFYKLETSKIDLDNYYTKGETYSDDEIDALLDDKADVDSNGYAEVSGLKSSTQSANTDDIINGIFKVINVDTEIVNNQISQDTFNKLTSGLFVLLKGTYRSRIDVLLKLVNTSGIYRSFSAITNQGYEFLTFNTSTMKFEENYRSLAICTGNTSYQINLDPYYFKGKTIPSFLANNVDGQLVYRNNQMAWLDDTPVKDTTSTSYSGGISSNKEYSFTQPLTALNIVSLVITTGDNLPTWRIHFKVGSGFAFTSTPTLVWRDGQPTWTDLVGEEVEILIEPSLTANTYNAWIIK